MNIFGLTLILCGLAPTVEYTGDSVFHTVNYNNIIEHKLRMPVVVYVNGGISESSAIEFARNMHKAKRTGQPIIPVVISSYGGSPYALLDMMDVIDTIGVPVATIVYGKAMSAGAALLSCGSKRFMMPSSTVMIHEASSGTVGKVSGMETDTKEAKRVSKLVLEKMARNIGKPSSYFIDLIHKRGHTDWYLAAEEAKQMGLIDTIGLPEFKVKIDVGITLE